MASLYPPQPSSALFGIGAGITLQRFSLVFFFLFLVQSLSLFQSHQRSSLAGLLYLTQLHCCERVLLASCLEALMISAGFVIRTAVVIPLTLPNPWTISSIENVPLKTTRLMLSISSPVSRADVAYIAPFIWRYRASSVLSIREAARVFRIASHDY